MTSIAGVPQWLTNIVSLGGLVAIGSWVVVFLKHYTTKSKELRELHSEMSGTLRVALEDQKALRKADEAEFTKSIAAMKERIADYQQAVNAQAAHLRLAKKREALVALGTHFAHSLRMIQSREESNKRSSELYAEIGMISLLPPDKRMTKDAALKEPYDEELPPTGRSIRTLALAFAGELAKAQLRLDSVAHIVPSLMRDCDDNPGLSIAELFDRLHSRLEANDIDLRPWTPRQPS